MYMLSNFRNLIPFFYILPRSYGEIMLELKAGPLHFYQNSFFIPFFWTLKELKASYHVISGSFVHLTSKKLHLTTFLITLLQQLIVVVKEVPESKL